ncbi:DNA topology modulation protein [Halobacillus andaensis]|uniref:DNA topology modulation protein n=1 Tax=Halobacillus andaensis TaxID=1176239 RepID=UPI003D75AD6B
MKRVVLIGSGGSGKSTLARRLGEKLQINVYHLDALFWNPNWIGVPKDEQRKILLELVRKEEWIIDGNYGGTMSVRLSAADTIIFLDLPRIICVHRAFKRMLQYRSKISPDMGEGCEERFNFEFFKWIWYFPTTKRPEILKRLDQLSKAQQVTILKTPKEVREFLAKLE